MPGINKSFLAENLNWIATDQITGVWEFLKAVGLLDGFVIFGAFLFGSVRGRFQQYGVSFQINWTEPWLLGLIGFHVLVFLIAIFTRKYTNFQAVLFICLLVLAFATERLNELGAKHWRLFSREQYFDSKGLFIMVVFAGPLLFNCFLMMVIWTCTAARMLIVVKRGQLKEKMKQQSKEKDKKE